MRQSLVRYSPQFYPDIRREAANLRAGSRRGLRRYATVRSIVRQAGKTSTGSRLSFWRSSRVRYFKEPETVERAMVMFNCEETHSAQDVLQGAGVTLALPLLESMYQALVLRRKRRPRVKSRGFVGIFNPHGWEPGHWAMNEGDSDNSSLYSVSPLEPWKDSITVISGLDATSSMPAPGETGGDHSRSGRRVSAGFSRRNRQRGYPSGDDHRSDHRPEVRANRNAPPSIQVKCERPELACNRVRGATAART